MRLRIASAGLVLALVTGGAYLASVGSSGDNEITGPNPEQRDEASELLRLLERTPYDPEGTSFSYLDFEVARRGPIETTRAANGNQIVSPTALGWAPTLPIDVRAALLHPNAHEDAFGYAFEDIERTLFFDLANSDYANIVMLNGDSSGALDRATTPSWAEQETRIQEGSFDVLDWGDGISIANRSDIRPFGETGQLTAFDGDMILQTMNRERLETVLATERGAPNLGDLDQLLAALAELDLAETVGLKALIYSVDVVQNEIPRYLPPLVVVAASLDGSSRAVLGFLPRNDTGAIEASLRTTIGSSVTLPAAADSGPRVMNTTVTRSSDLILIDFSPDTSAARPGNTSELWEHIRNLFIENPEILS